MSRTLVFQDSPSPLLVFCDLQGGSSEHTELRMEDRKHLLLSKARRPPRGWVAWATGPASALATLPRGEMASGQRQEYGNPCLSVNLHYFLLFLQQITSKRWFSCPGDLKSHFGLIVKGIEESSVSLLVIESLQIDGTLMIFCQVSPKSRIQLRSHPFD